MSGSTSGDISGSHHTDIPDASHPRERTRRRITIKAGEFAQNWAVREATKIGKNFFTGSWNSWKDIPKTERDRMWVMFCSKFTWPSNQDTAVHEAWDLKMEKLVREFLHAARKGAIREYCKVPGNVWNYDNPDMSLLAIYPPDFIQSQHWATLCNGAKSRELWISVDELGEGMEKTQSPRGKEEKD